MAVVAVAAPALLATRAAASPEGFLDVAEDHRFAEPIAWLVGEEITTGVDDLRYAPDDSVSRGQMAAFLWRHAGEPPVGHVHDFDDVDQDSWNADAVGYLAERGITEGVGDNRFAGSDPVTRGQLATFLWRDAGEPDADGPRFDDVDTGSAHGTAIAWLVDEGITQGVTDTEYGPFDPVTRGQMAAFLWRAEGEPATDPLPTPDPVSSDWDDIGPEDLISAANRGVAAGCFSDLTDHDGWTETGDRSWSSDPQGEGPGNYQGIISLEVSGDTHGDDTEELIASAWCTNHTGQMHATLAIFDHAVDTDELYVLSTLEPEGEWGGFRSWRGVWTSWISGSVVPLGDDGVEVEIVHTDQERPDEEASGTIRWEWSMHFNQFRVHEDNVSW